MTSYSKTIGERIHQIRNSLSMSQEKLALNADLATSFIRDIESGKKNPSTVSLEKISAALGISLRELFNYDLDTMKNHDDFYLDKILIEVRNCSNAEQEALYRLLKQAIEYKNIRE